jgi:hypothetical protein
MSDDYRLRADLQRIVADAGAAPHWNTASDKPVVPDRYTRAEVEAAVKRAIDACASVAFDEVMYGACPHRTQRKVLDILLDPAALERIINGGRE